MLTITLTHANDGMKMCFNVPLIFYWYHSAAHGCTHLVSNGGAFAPVKESVDEVTRLINSAKQGAQEVKDGIQTRK